MRTLSITCTVAVSLMLFSVSASAALINTYGGPGPTYVSNITTTRSSHYNGVGVNGLNSDDLVNGLGFITGTAPPTFTNGSGDLDNDGIPAHYWFDQLADGLWLSNGNATATEWVAFDLGATFLLEKMRVWNWDQDGGSDRSVATANIWYSADVSPVLPVGPATNPAVSGWTQLGAGPFAFQNVTGPNFDTVDDILFPLTGFGGIYARHVLIDVITNHGGDAFVGLAEVQFFDTVAVPEPSTLALLSLGAVGLTIRTRRRHTAA